MWWEILLSPPLEWPPNLSKWRDWYWAATQLDQSNTPLHVLNAGVAIDGQLKSRSARLKEYTQQPPLALKYCLPRRKSPCYRDLSTWGTWSTWLAFKSSSHSIEVNVHLMCWCAWHTVPELDTSAWNIVVSKVDAHVERPGLAMGTWHKRFHRCPTSASTWPSSSPSPSTSTSPSSLSAA